MFIVVIPVCKKIWNIEKYLLIINVKKSNHKGYRKNYPAREIQEVLETDYYCPLATVIFSCYQGPRQISKK